MRDLEESFLRLLLDRGLKKLRRPTAATLEGRMGKESTRPRGGKGASERLRTASEKNSETYDSLLGSMSCSAFKASM